VLSSFNGWDNSVSTVSVLFLLTPACSDSLFVLPLICSCIQIPCIPFDPERSLWGIFFSVCSLFMDMYQEGRFDLAVVVMLAHFFLKSYLSRNVMMSYLT
jgi:hypothetical protein